MHHIGIKNCEKKIRTTSIFFSFPPDEIHLTYFFDYIRVNHFIYNHPKFYWDNWVFVDSLTVTSWARLSSPQISYHRFS